jgi:hypothetical protein
VCDVVAAIAGEVQRLSMPVLALAGGGARGVQVSASCHGWRYALLQQVVDLGWCR